jgi:hypothetical protein
VRISNLLGQPAAERMSHCDEPNIRAIAAGRLDPLDDHADIFAHLIVLIKLRR